MGLGENKAVIGGHDDIVPVKAVDDELHQVANLVDRLPSRLECQMLGRPLVANGVNSVVVDIDDLLPGHGIPTLFLLHRQEVVGLHHHAINGSKDYAAIVR